jgi:asparagine synthase (glutamine-hydrolysing)
MCGIAGVISRRPAPFSPEMMSVMGHRGPDHTHLSELQSHGYFLQLLHHRLSIIDLVDASNQPFFDATGRYSIVFNGEIYNYIELRKELQALGVDFKTASDTEVLLQAMIVWGERAFNKLNGMFAFLFTDLHLGKGFIARDPFGEKPFYYHLRDEKFSFSSEIKFLLAATPEKFGVNKLVLAQYFSSHYLEATEEDTFFEGIKKFPAGAFSSFDLSGEFKLNIQRYYSPKVNENSRITNLDDAESQIRWALDESVRLRLRSDVPVGLFLSGGVDSSILAHLVKKHHSNVQFVSVVSDDPAYDESSFINIVEKNLKQEAIKINIQTRAQEFYELLPKVGWHNDEPLTSFSAVAYYKMIEAAKQNGLKVLLTGQGADEVFLGYKKFKFWHYKNLFRSGKIIGLSKALFDEGGNSDLFESFSLSEASRYLPGFMKGSKRAAWGNKIIDVALAARKTGSMEQAQIEDLKAYSVPVLLHIEDRLSMAYGTEVRVPFLDRSIVDLGLQLDTNLKIRDGFSKYALRSAYRGLVPDPIIWRRDKKGFSIPQDKWIRDELSGNIESLFKSDMISYDLGILDKKANLQDYQAYKNNESKLVGYKDIFARLSLEMWLKSFSHSIKGEL